MKHVTCALCGADDTRLLFPATISPSDIGAALFSARRVPDRVHLDIVRCRRCSLVYSTPALDDDELARLYRESGFSYVELTDDIARNYLTYIHRALPHLPSTERFLEIGCGNGFLLPHVKALGFREVLGVEPVEQAVRAARDDVQPSITRAMFSRSLFPATHFDLIAFFQTLDHIASPNAFLSDVMHVLKPGGIALALHHDVEALTAKLLGERSPIFDVEHPILYSRATLAAMFRKHGFHVVETGAASNAYPLRYWMHLAPIPSTVRAVARRATELLQLSERRIRIRAGNLFVIARKPA